MDYSGVAIKCPKASLASPWVRPFGAGVGNSAALNLKEPFGDEAVLHVSSAPHRLCISESEEIWGASV